MKHPRLVDGGVPCVKIATTQWEATPLLLPSTLESYGEILHSTKLPSSSEDIARV